MARIKGKFQLPKIDEKLSFDVDKEDLKKFIHQLIDDPAFMQEFKEKPVHHLQKLGIELSLETQKKIESTVSKPFTLLAEEPEAAKIGPGAALVVVAVYTASDGPVH